MKEKKRQKHFINLIPSENFTSQAVLDALGSVMQSTAPPLAKWNKAKIMQTNTLKDILVLDTMEGMNTLTSLSDSARKEHCRRLA